LFLCSGSPGGGAAPRDQILSPCRNELIRLSGNDYGYKL
jgi:hypothetical protein